MTNKTKDQSGGVNANDIKAKGDVVGRDKIIKITLLSTGSVIVIGLLVFAYSLISPFVNKPPIPLAPMPTLLAFKPSEPDETLLIIADFDDRSAGQFAGIDPAQRIYELITSKLPGSNMKLRVEQYHQPVKDSAEARRVLNAYGATLLIWGWYDKLGAEPNVELDKERIALVNPQMHEVSLATPESFVVKFTHEIPSQSAYVAFFSLGMMQVDLDRVAAAAFFTQAIDSASQAEDVVDPWEALMWRGNIYCWSGEYELAIQDHSRVLDLHPHKEGYFNRANDYREQGNYGAAIADYTKAITVDLEYSDAYAARAAVYNYNLSKYDVAIADYTQAITIDSKYSGAYLGRGNAYWAQGKYEEAIADYTQAIKIDPEYKEVYFARGLSYENEGKYDEAIADYSKAIKLNPKDSDVYDSRGNAYKVQGKYELAIADYTEAITITPGLARYYTGRGNIYADWKKYKQAVADYRKSIDLDPSSYPYCVMGITYTKMGDFPSAITALEQGVRLDTKSEYPWCKTALGNAQLGTPTP
jgi:tetratricopeptide (TPR) repeat protein